MISLPCPHCQETESVCPFGSNRKGTKRCRCKNCGKTFTLNSKHEWLLGKKRAAAAAVPEVAARLAAQEANGTRVHRMTDFHGAARLHTKTVAEMEQAKEESRKNAQAADKGKMTTNA